MTTQDILFNELREAVDQLNTTEALEKEGLEKQLLEALKPFEADFDLATAIQQQEAAATLAPEKVKMDQKVAVIMRNAERRMQHAVKVFGDFQKGVEAEFYRNPVVKAAQEAKEEATKYLRDKFAQDIAAISDRTDRAVRTLQHEYDEQAQLLALNPEKPTDIQ